MKHIKVFEGVFDEAVDLITNDTPTQNAIRDHFVNVYDIQVGKWSGNTYTIEEVGYTVGETVTELLLLLHIDNYGTVVLESYKDNDLMGYIEYKNVTSVEDMFEKMHESLVKYLDLFKKIADEMYEIIGLLNQITAKEQVILNYVNKDLFEI